MPPRAGLDLWRLREFLPGRSSSPRLGRTPIALGSGSLQVAQVVGAGRVCRGQGLTVPGGGGHLPGGWKGLHGGGGRGKAGAGNPVPIGGERQGRKV